MSLANCSTAPCGSRAKCGGRSISLIRTWGATCRPHCATSKNSNWLAAWKYRPKVYDGRVTLFWASNDLNAKFDLIEGWQTLARDGMELHKIPGTHLDMIKEPHVSELARVLNDCLLKAQL